MESDDRLVYDATMLALQLGNVATARDLFDEASPESRQGSGQWSRLADILLGSEAVEANHGRGSLLDTDHPLIAYCIKIKRFDSEMVEAANRFQADALAISALEDFVPGLTRHQGRQLRR